MERFYFTLRYSMGASVWSAHSNSLAVALELCYVRIHQELARRRQNRYRPREEPFTSGILLYLASHFAHADCCDTRDKIFGLRSFALPCCHESIPVNYLVDKHVLFEELLSHHYTPHFTIGVGYALFISSAIPKEGPRS